MQRPAQISVVHPQYHPARSSQVLFHSGSETMHANSSKPCFSWTVLAVIATTTMLSGGCAKLQHAWHYNPVTRSLHEHRLSYYHSSHTGRVIPDEHHPICPGPLPCFGYSPTCWHRWPQECVNCPVQATDGMFLHGGHEGLPIVEGEVLGEPSAVDTLESVGPSEAAPSGDESPLPPAIEDALEPGPLPGDGLQDSASGSTGGKSAADRLAELKRRSFETMETLFGSGRTAVAPEPRNQPKVAPQSPAKNDEASNDGSSFGVPTQGPAMVQPEVPAFKTRTQPATTTTQKTTLAEPRPVVAHQTAAPKAVETPRIAIDVDVQEKTERLVTDQSIVQTLARNVNDPAVVPPMPTQVRKSSRRRYAETPSSAVAQAAPDQLMVAPRTEDTQAPASATPSEPVAQITTEQVQQRPAPVRTLLDPVEHVAEVVNRRDPFPKAAAARPEAVLPSFKIVPVMPAVGQPATPNLQVDSRPASTVRFIAERDAQPLRVANQADDAATLKFR